jgi:hypothetical protein
MQIRRAVYFYGLGGGAVIVAGALAYVLIIAPSTPPTQVGERQFVNLSLKKGIEDCATYVKNPNGGAEAYLCVKENRYLVLSWDNIPRDTRNIDIYRMKEGDSALSLWQSIDVSGGGSGELIIGEVGVSVPGGAATVGTLEELALLSFYIEATGADGEILYTSATSTPTSTVPLEPTTTEPAVPLPPPTTEPTVTPTTTPTSTVPVVTAPTTTPTSTTPVTQPTSTTPYYYTPDGQVSSYTPPPAPEHFWVQYVNKKIEIGWSILPPETTRVVIYRSASSQGEWLQLLAQESPVTSYYTIRLVDNTMAEPYYYRLVAFGDSETLVSYGPELLAPLTP